jgi:hypothetical protein
MLGTSTLCNAISLAGRPASRACDAIDPQPASNKATTDSREHERTTLFTTLLTCVSHFALRLDAPVAGTDRQSVRAVQKSFDASPGGVGPGTTPRANRCRRSRSAGRTGPESGPAYIRRTDAAPTCGSNQSAVAVPNAASTGHADPPTTTCVTTMTKMRIDAARIPCPLQGPPRTSRPPHPSSKRSPVPPPTQPRQAPSTPVRAAHPRAGLPPPRAQPAPVCGSTS